MHLPLLPEQALHSGQPSLPLAVMIDGVALALSVALRTADDLRSAEGALD